MALASPPGSLVVGRGSRGDRGTAPRRQRGKRAYDSDSEGDCSGMEGDSRAAEEAALKHDIAALEVQLLLELCRPQFSSCKSVDLGF